MCVGGGGGGGSTSNVYLLRSNGPGGTKTDINQNSTRYSHCSPLNHPQVHLTVIYVPISMSVFAISIYACRDLIGHFHLLKNS